MTTLVPADRNPEQYIVDRTPIYVTVDDARGTRTIRLVGSDNEREGRVEVYLDGKWGTVCDDGWTHQEAMVACHGLGYMDAERSFVGGHFARPSRNVPIHYDDLSCTGDETALSQCPRNTDAHNCASDHSEDVGVRCTDTRMQQGPRGDGGDGAQNAGADRRNAQRSTSCAKRHGPSGRTGAESQRKHSTEDPTCKEEPSPGTPQSGSQRSR